MSLILDALNRSDSERANPDAAPGLHTVHGTGVQDIPLWRKALWPGLALVLAILAVLPWLGDRDPATPSASDAASERSAGAVETQAPGPALPVDLAKELPASASSRVSKAPETEVGVDVAALYESRSTEASAPPATTSSPEAPMAAPADPARDAGADDSQSLDVAELAKAAEAALAERRPASEPIVEHEAPFVIDLSQSVKDQIPSIFYSAHKWASNPAQRSVVLNGEERRAGQQVKPGLRLVEILEDSIVLDFRGTEFRLHSLNSWVNL